VLFLLLANLDRGIMAATYLKSEGARLTATAVAACAITILSVASYQSATKRKRRLELQREVKDALASTPPESELSLDHPAFALPKPQDLGAQLSSKNFDETIVREMLARNYAFLGEQPMNKVRGGRVVVVGCGGVGSWAAVMLMRS
jgi:hypothetical protein